MRMKMIELVRFTCIVEGEEENLNVVDIPAKRVTRNGRVSLAHTFSGDLYAADKTYEQGLHLSDALKFTFRESSGSKKDKKIYEMYCFKDQEYIGSKIFNKRLKKVISKEEKKNENQKCSG